MTSFVKFETTPNLKLAFQLAATLCPTARYVVKIAVNRDNAEGHIFLARCVAVLSASYLEDVEHNNVQSTTAHEEFIELFRALGSPREYSTC